MPLCHLLRTAQHASPRSGYTLIELLVVLVLLTIASAIVAPSLLLRSRDQPSSLQTVVGTAREAAVRRGELVRLHIDRSGGWQASAATGEGTEILMSGKLSDTRGSADLLFSPLGTCGPSAEDAPVEALGAFDPLTCEAR